MRILKRLRLKAHVALTKPPPNGFETRTCVRKALPIWFVLGPGESCDVADASVLSIREAIALLVTINRLASDCDSAHLPCRSLRVRQQGNTPHRQGRNTFQPRASK